MSGEESVTRARVQGLAALAAGLALLVAYAVLSCGLANGRAEFAYYPFVVASLPWGAMRGFTWEQLADHAYRLVVLGPALVLLSIAAHRLLPASWPGRIDPRRIAIVAGAASVGAIAFVMLVILRGRATTDDELAYRMLASFFADGRLLGKDVGYFPIGVFSVRAGTSYTVKYLFGEGLVQTLGVLLDRPALLHVPIAAAGLAAYHRAVRLAAGPTIAAWATFFFAIGPAFVLTSATGLTEGPSLACIAAAGLGYEWARGPRPRTGAVLVAAALGFCATIRPQSAFPAALVLGSASAWALARRRDVPALALMALVGACGLVAIGAYDHAVTGSALKLPWSLQCYEEHYGFGRVWKHLSFAHTLGTALENQLVTAVRFNGWWLGWPLGLGVLPLWWLLGRPWRGAGIWIGVGAAVAVFEAGFYSTGASDTGPIYHVELLLPASLLAANTLVAALDRWPRAAAAALAVHVAFGTGSFLVVHAARLHRLVTAIYADADAALARIPGEAVLLYETRRSETLPVGWLFDPFPRHYRSDRDRVVTYPRPARSRIAGLLASYPGRSCWYYHRDERTERAELLPCEQAGRYLDRGLDDIARDLWIQPTAFKKTSFDPWAEIRAVTEARRSGDVPCCTLEEWAAMGADVQGRRCVP